MSEKKVRYFLHDDGQVVWSRCSDLSPYHTEVQVVPLDAIVIRRDELPEVWIDGSQRRVESENMSVHDSYSWREVRRTSLASLAISESLREHPTVDEEQVARISKLIVAAGHEDINYLDVAKIAYRLAERGFRVGDA